MTDSPVALLRQAEALIRERVAAVKAASHTDWQNRPWAVESCAKNYPCIVYQGEYKPVDEPQVPPIQYVADAESEAHAAYIAGMHPGVALALAALLEAEARAYEGYESSNLDPALAVARAVLGGAR